MASSVVAALGFGLAAPAGAQELGAIEIDPTEGAPGTEVSAALVDPGVVNEQCATTPEEVNAMYLDDQGFRWPDFPDVVVSALNPGPVFSEFTSHGPSIGFDVPDEWPDASPPFGFIGPPPEGANEVHYAFAWYGQGGLGEEPERTSHEQDAAAAMQIFMSLLGSDSPAIDSYLPGTFVLTFADVATQAPVGPTGNFDPATGEGSIEVPDVEPGLYALAATCVVPETTEASFANALAAGAAVLEENGHPVGGRIDILNPMFQETVEAMLAELMQPSGGPWVEFFCVTDADGECPDDEPPTDPPDVDGPLDPDLDDLGDLDDPGDDIPGGDTTTPAAPAVTGSPDLTG